MEAWRLVFFDEVVPSPAGQEITTVYRREYPRLLIGNVVMTEHPDSNPQRIHGAPDLGPGGWLLAAHWECARCNGKQSRDLWSRSRWARKALIGHWYRMHSPRAVELHGAG
jgi:hypothetical protein